MPTLPLYNTEPGFEDHLSCYTTFQPLGDPSLDLRALVVKNGASGKGFTYHNIDEVEHKDTIKRAKERGYKDFKTVLSGNKEDGPLSLKIKVSKRGTVYLCEPAGIWGHFPKGYSSFWKTGTKIYINENAPRRRWMWAISSSVRIERGSLRTRIRIPRTHKPYV